ncbi:MAG TPA: undecaprenyl-diphosphate phosphatase [Candidatus Limiplasma sp.]|nr:undecaprenyl-diphosphate phosphatase [Candidatus Limiplasma sp.]HPS80660.1 undecaprenyl-diphosphate phosphatase [Candidatus Limiplasma sp.]
MSMILAALLGLIQGLTEFLPVSSSGHLNLLQALFQVNLNNQLLFNILLHVGSLTAVLVVFWKDWLQMILHPIRNRTLLLLVVASLPALAAKVIFGDQLDYLETHNLLLGVCFLLTGLLLMLAQWLATVNQRRQCETSTVGVRHALVMGCLQAVGMLPGVSRSGSTLFGGVASRLDRQTAAKFSFMMSLPAILASFLSEGYHAVKGGMVFQSADLPAVAVGVIVAAASGYLAIRFMLRVITKISLNWFALYVILLGIAVIVLQSVGVMADAPDALAAAARNLTALF